MLLLIIPNLFLMLLMVRSVTEFQLAHSLASIERQASSFHQDLTRSDTEIWSKLLKQILIEHVRAA